MTVPHIDIQAPDIGTVVELYDVDCTALPGLLTVLRFTPSSLIVDPTAPIPEPIIWQGNTYQPRACESTDWSWDGQGPMPRPKLSLGNTDLAISAICISNSDLQGAVVTRHRVPMKYLDGGSAADPTVEFDPDVFVIDQKTTQNKMVVEFSLGASIDIEGRMIPGRQVIQSYCSFRYRIWNGTSFVYSQGLAACPYTGGFYFDANGNATADPSLDACSKRLISGCQKRFAGDLPFGGFPGAAQFTG